MNNWPSRVEIDAAKLRKHFKNTKQKIAHIAIEVDMSPSRLYQALLNDKTKLTVEEAKRIAEAIDLPFDAFATLKSSKVKKVHSAKGNEQKKEKVEKFKGHVQIIRFKAKNSGVKFAQICRNQGLPADYITSQLSHEDCKFTIEVLDLIAKSLKCRISEIAIIPRKLDVDYTHDTIKESQPMSKHQIIKPTKPQQHWVPKPELISDPKLDPRYLRNNVDIIPGMMNGNNSCQPSSSTHSRHIEFKIDGMVAFRYENGHAILFANEYIASEDMIEAFKQIRTWGEQATQGERK